MPWQLGLTAFAANLLPPPPTDVNIYALSDTDRETLNIGSLPASLEEALNEMEKDPLVSSVLGRTSRRNILRPSSQEWNDYRVRFHPGNWKRICAIIKVKPCAT